MKIEILISKCSALLIVTAMLTANTDAQDSPTYIDAEDCVVRFAKEVNVPSLETGSVDEVAVRQNDFVTSDQEIARLDARRLLIRRRSAQLKAKVARDQSTDETEIDFAEVALKEAKEELDNSRSISKESRGVIPRSEIRRMLLSVERANLEVTQATKRRERAAVEAESLEAELAVIDDQLRQLHCLSPINGIVLNVARNEGEWIAKGETIAKIGQIDRIHVHALISSKDVSPVSCQGLPASVHWTDVSTGKNYSLRGKVLSVDPQLFPGAHYRIHAEIVNEQWGAESVPAANGLRDESHRQNITGWKLIPGTVVTMRVYPSGSIARRAGDRDQWTRR